MMQRIFGAMHNIVINIQRRKLGEIATSFDQALSRKHRFGLSSSTPPLLVDDHTDILLKNTTVSQVLKSKSGEDEEGSHVLCCRTSDTVFDAVMHMTKNNVGSLVVLKPGERNLIAGIITERDYLKKIVVQGRSSKTTIVGEIMTDENKLVTVNGDTNILHAMQLMTDKHIRHVPVIEKRLVGMVSIVDVVRVVVEQQREELKRLNNFIKGDYY